jgi:glutamate racemase
MIGVFDSGVGGLSILRALLAELPGESFIYLADSGHAPYGERDNAHVLTRSRIVTAYLRNQGCRAMVVACNTATAIAIDTLRAENPDLPLIGVEPGLKPALAASRTHRIGVMATRSTLASARFGQLMAALKGEADFVLQACDGLAGSIEHSTRKTPAGAHAELLAECKRHIGAMGSFGDGPGDIDTLVLGCTHYPFALEALRQLVGPAVRFIDPGEPVARQTRLRLPDLSDLPDLPPLPARTSTMKDTVSRIGFLTTGEPAALTAAVQRWLDLDAGSSAATQLFETSAGLSQELPASISTV